MTWIAVIILALAAFALAAFAFKLTKGLWTSLLAALALGLAGYALQASPNLPGAPKSGDEGDANPLFDIVEARREMVADNERSGADFTLVADAMARQGRYENAAQMLSGVTRANPQDFDAWMALGNALVEHADGVLTPPALYAYRRAVTLRPRHLAPNYFLGVSLIRQGRMMEARQVWSDALANAPEDASGRAAMVERLDRLQAMLGAIASEAGQSAESPEE